MSNVHLVIVTDEVDHEVFTDLVHDATLKEDPLCFVYGEDEYYEESGCIGCIYKDGSCSVVGLHRDHMCDLYTMVYFVLNSV